MEARVNVASGTAARVSARDDARTLAALFAPDQGDPRKAQSFAYRVMPEPALLSIEPVVVNPGWLERRRVRVFCQECGEGINYQREVTGEGRTLCRPRGGERYYAAR